MVYQRLRALLTLSLLFMLLTVCDDLEGALDDSAVGGVTAVNWATPIWASTVWELSGSGGCSGSTFSFFDASLGTICGRCPRNYTWRGSADPDFCYQCPDGYTFDTFPDGDFCYECPAGYDLGVVDGTYRCIPPGGS